MSNNEMALQLTLAALENGLIMMNPYKYENDEKTEKANAFNAKQISDFMLALSRELSPAEK